jgi:TonB family protein
MNFSRLKYVLGSIAAVMATTTLLQACHESYGTANISTIQGRMIDDRNKAPALTGALLSLRKYVVGELDYPRGAMLNRVEGTVYIRFYIDDQGNISDISPVGDRLGYGLEEEAMRVIASMPESISMAIKGRSDANTILPITYKIKENGSDNAGIKTSAVILPLPAI